MSQHLFNPPALEYYPRLRRVRERLERQIEEPLPTSAAARVAGLNANYFSTYFRSKVGLRFTEWSRQIRIERARAILRNEACSIQEVARRVGYTGQRAFERAFKRQVEMTASEFRRGG